MTSPWISSKNLQILAHEQDKGEKLANQFELDIETWIFYLKKKLIKLIIKHIWMN